MKTYKEITDELKAKSPAGTNFKDIQKAASEIFKQQKETQDKQKKATPSPAHVATSPEAGKITTKAFASTRKGGANQADDICDAINKQGNINRNSILAVARNYDTSFHLVEDHKIGVNTMVYLDGPYRVPREGFWKIFIAKPSQ